MLASESLFQSATAGDANRWPSVALLSIPDRTLPASYRLRFSFEIPVTQRANWIFRLANPAASEVRSYWRIMLIAPDSTAACNHAPGVQFRVGLATQE